MPIGFVKKDARHQIAIEVVTSENQNPVFVFPARTIRIGRDAGNDIVLANPEWRGISRHHVEVRWANDLWRVVDLGSLNGTYLNGHRVTDSPLNSGDEIRCGTQGPPLRVFLPEILIPTRAEPPEGTPAKR
jgi:pSer/pThr/pTyr-binding forkhead associated (FHA) protein